MEIIKSNLISKGHKDLFLVLASIAPNAPGDIRALCEHKYSCNVKSIGNSNTSFIISGIKDRSGLIQDLKFLHYHVKEDGPNIKVEISGHGDQSYDWRSKWNAEHLNAPKNYEPINASTSTIPDNAKPNYENFVKRTTEHIQRVYDNCVKISENFKDLDTDEIIQRGIDHDASKFQSEELIPYIYLTEFYRAKNSGESFEYSDGMKKEVDKACEHHVMNNRHHIEFHELLCDMTDEDIAEMVADWAAISQELDNSLVEWKNRFVKDHVGFTEDQISLIDSLVALF